MKIQKRYRRSRVIKVKDEKNFYKVIEERLEQEGFQCVETLPSISSKTTWVNAGC